MSDESLSEPKEITRKLIKTCFLSMLRRPASDHDIDHHEMLLESGVSLANLLTSIADSDEARAVRDQSRPFGEGPTEDSNFQSIREYREDQNEIAIQSMYMATFNRRAAPTEIKLWQAAIGQEITLSQFVKSIAECPEAVIHQSLSRQELNLSCEEFIITILRDIVDESCGPIEFSSWAERLRRKDVTENKILTHFVQLKLAKTRKASLPRTQAAATASPVYELGTNRVIEMARWFNKAFWNPYVLTPKHTLKDATKERKSPEVLVSVIASMYNGKSYIKYYMENIVHQTIFEESCELIIVDAASPENEISLIQPYLKRFANIKYIRAKERIGIYEAWNVGIRQSSGKYITNANLDDLRRRDSLEVQLTCFEKLGFPDIVFQDFYYSFEDKATFKDIEKRGIRTRLPHVTPVNLIYFNSPHNAPMWKRQLHDEIGWFDERYFSAGDCDFWLRCQIAGKVFYKINDVHVAYYHNPNGLSTKAETLGITEHARILHKLQAGLLSEPLRVPLEKFIAEVGSTTDPASMELSRYDIVQLRLLTLEEEYQAEAGVVVQDADSTEDAMSSP